VLTKLTRVKKINAHALIYFIQLLNSVQQKF